MTDIERHLSVNGARATPDDAEGEGCGVVEVGH